jgi:hypothetical protein
MSPELQIKQEGSVTVELRMTIPWIQRSARGPSKRRGLSISLSTGVFMVNGSGGKSVQRPQRKKIW